MRECDNSKIHFSFIFFFLRTVKYNNFVPYDLSLYNKRATTILGEKKKVLPWKGRVWPWKGPVVEKCTAVAAAFAMVLRIFL
jgi:hypothetical protein